jgi:putative transposase
MDYQRDEHRVHLIVYHLIWCPKRRKKVLVKDVAKDCKALIGEVCASQDWQILELAVLPDHIHLFVRARTTDSAADIVARVKGRTSHDLRAKYPHLLKLPSLWTRSYFASTAGNISTETIKRYIDAQKGI